MTTTSPVIRTSGSSFIGPDGEPLILRGVCLGGWLNMENFITGYSGERVADEDRGTPGHRRRSGRALLRPAPLPLLRRGRRRLPGGRRASTWPASPSATSTSRTTPGRSRSRLMASATWTERSRRSPSTACTRSSTCTPCPAPRTSTGTPTTPRTSPRSGSTGTSRTGSCTSGKPSPSTTAATRGWRDTTC